MTRPRLAGLVGAALLGLAAWATPPAAPARGEAAGTDPGEASPPRCRPGSLPGLVAFDTGAGTSLWSLETGAGRHWAVLDPDAEAVPTHPAEGEPRFAGSVGAGPLFAWRSCGSGCFQAERFRNGAWSPLGPPLRLAERGRLATTYAHDGAAWVALVEPAEGERRRVTAYRHEAGTWVPKGRLSVLAGGSPALLPAPFADDAVVSGSGVFSATAAPRHWLRGLPSVPEDRETVALPLGLEGAVVLTQDGEIFQSRDRGATWSLSRFRPWRVGRVDVWKHGSDYSLDLPVGALGSALPIAWFDRRPRREPEIVLTERAPGEEDGRRLAEVSPTLRDPDRSGADAPRFEISDLLRQVNGSWTLIAGCADRQDASGLLVRRILLGGPEEPRFLPLRAGA